VWKTPVNVIRCGDEIGPVAAEEIKKHKNKLSQLKTKWNGSAVPPLGKRIP
jgi:hypothetical protein